MCSVFLSHRMTKELLSLMTLLSEEETAAAWWPIGSNWNGPPTPTAWWRRRSSASSTSGGWRNLAWHQKHSHATLYNVYIPYITHLMCIYCTLYHLLHLAYAVRPSLIHIYLCLYIIHIYEPTRRTPRAYSGLWLKKKRWYFRITSLSSTLFCSKSNQIKSNFICHIHVVSRCLCECNEMLVLLVPTVQ